MRVEIDEPVHRTGLMYLGSIVGDHVKLAINTRLGTGTVVGTGAMVACAAFPPACVRRFAWLTDRGEQVFRFNKFMDTAEVVMKRREREASEAYVSVLRELHERWADGG